jgi:hypothetical protein
MTYYSGRHGSLRYLGKPVAKVRDWSLSVAVDLLETTTVDLFAPTYRPGVKSATGSATALYYRPDIYEGSEKVSFLKLAQRVVRPGPPDESDRISLELALGGDAQDVLLLNAYITSIGVGSTAGEISSVQLDFTMDGDLIRGIG